MKKIILFIILAISVGARAQNQISLQQAIDLALKNNFDIIVSRHQADINRLNNTMGNAGMLPTVNINGTGDAGRFNVHQTLSSGVENKYSSQVTTDLGANAVLSWTLFDGGKMFVTKKRLSEMQASGELQYNAQVMAVMYDVIATYFDVVRQKEQLRYINEIIEYNKQRVVIAQTGFNAGTLPKTELLQAQIDMNVAMGDAITQEYAISEVLKSLNVLLGEEASSTIDVSDKIPASEVPDKSEMLQKVETSNADLLVLKKQIDVAQLSLKEAQSAYYPTFKMQGGYYYTKGTKSQGTDKSDQSYGMQVGGTLTIPIYTAGETKRKKAVAKTELMIAQNDLENAKLQINKDLLSAYDDFYSQQKLLKIEEQNHLLAKENMEICLQRLRLGQTTSLEVHQSQESYSQSSYRLINFEYNMKLAETKLKQMISAL